jgi:hypothetical protein
MNLLESIRMAALRATLLQIAADESFLPGLCYTGPEDFVSQHGRVYEIVPFTGRQGAPLMCYGNAVVEAAMRGLRYVEGYVVAPDGRIIPHAWNETPDGQLMDTTWCNTGTAYLGVEFSVERGDDATWNGDACVLDDKHRGYPIFTQPWRGEDYTLEWPYSDRLETLRQGAGFPASCTTWLKEKAGRA